MILATDLVGARTIDRSRHQRFGSIVRDKFSNAICAPNCISCSSENCFRKRAYKSLETFAGVSVIASANSMTTRSVSLNGVLVVAEHSEQFGIAHAHFSAHGRIDVYSERTTDTRRGADLSQLNVTQRDKSPTAKRSFHCNAAPDKSGQTHLDLCRGKIFSKHLSHYAVKPAQMPRCVFFLQT